MKDFELIFIDTSPFIYIIEDNKSFSAKVEEFLAESFAEEALFVTSVITVSEFEVKPKKLNNTQALRNFRELLEKFYFKIFDVTLEVAERSSDLRAKYDSLKLIDSLQLAIAIQHKCSKFYTNDHRLKHINRN